MLRWVIISSIRRETEWTFEEHGYLSIYRASVMSGCHAGVNVLLKEFMPKAVYVHCANHRLNLVINDTCKIVVYMTNYFSILSSLHSFFTESGVTNRYFKEAQQQLGLGDCSPQNLRGCDSSLFPCCSGIIYAETLGKYPLGF